MYDEMMGFFIVGIYYSYTGAGGQQRYGCGAEAVTAANEQYRQANFCREKKLVFLRNKCVCNIAVILWHILMSNLQALLMQRRSVAGDSNNIQAGLQRGRLYRVHQRAVIR
jgi:hypothetical protein